jgi:hypothetical protein
MLIYIRAHERPTYLKPCTKEDLPPPLLERFEQEKVSFEIAKRGKNETRRERKVEGERKRRREEGRANPL